MATIPIGGDSALVTLPSANIPLPAVALLAGRLLNKHSAHEIAEAVEVLIDVLDLLGGNPDEEDNDDREASDGDDQDQAYVEWTSMRGAAKRGPNVLAGEEDDEDDDPHGGEIDEDVPGFTPRDLAIANALGSGAGCSIGDPGGCEHDGRERDEGVLCLPTPPLPVFSFEPNIFTDQRVRLDKEG